MDMKIPKFQLLFTHMRSAERTQDDAKLIEIFQQHETAVSQYFESSLPENNPWANFGLPPKQFMKNMFQEGFKQFELVPTWELNTTVWNLLEDPNSCFWTAIDSQFPPIPSNT